MMTRRIIYFVLFLALLPAGCRNRQGTKDKIIIFHAGSLSVPFRQLADEYERRNPGTEVLLEPAGSLVCARKITELKKPCDIIASADYFVIDKLIIPKYAAWSIRFATNEIVIAYQEKSRYSSQINSQNWMDILLRDDVTYARSDPDSDPCGYRTVLMFKLAERYYWKPGLDDELQIKNRYFIRPKEVDLVALVESNAVDYMFQYKSVAIQHNLKYLELPDKINLGNPELDPVYNLVSYEVAGTRPEESMKVKGEYINYSLAVLNDAPNSEKAIDFVHFLLSEEGLEILRKNGQDPIKPLIADHPDQVPRKLRKYID